MNKLLLIFVVILIAFGATASNIGARPSVNEDPGSGGYWCAGNSGVLGVQHVIYFDGYNNGTDAYGSHHYQCISSYQWVVYDPYWGYIGDYCGCLPGHFIASGKMWWTIP